MFEDEKSSVLEVPTFSLLVHDSFLKGTTLCVRDRIRTCMIVVLNVSTLTYLMLIYTVFGYRVNPNRQRLPFRHSDYVTVLY